LLFSFYTGDCLTGEHTIESTMFSTWDNVNYGESDQYYEGSGQYYDYYDGSGQDNEFSDESCAQRYKGGWWYNGCNECNPNGLYLQGDNNQTGQGMTYAPWKGQHYSLKEIQIMVRRRE
jgi:ficolin